MSTSLRVFNILEEKRGDLDIAKFMRSIKLDENIYHNVKRGRKPNFDTLRELCLKLELNPEDTYFLLTGKRYESKKDNNTKEDVKKNFAQIASELNASVSELRQLILEIPQNRQQDTINIDYVRKTLQENGYNNEQFIALCGFNEGEENAVMGLEILSRKKDFKDIDPLKQKLLSDFFALGLTIITGRSSTHEYEALIINQG